MTAASDPYMVNINPFASPQTMFPYEPGYVPPSKANNAPRQTPPSRPAPPAPAAPVASGIEGLDDAELSIMACTNQFQRHVATLRTDGLTQAGVQAAIASFENSPEVQRMDADVARLEAIAAAAQQKQADALAAVNTEGDSAAQATRATRVWDRERAGLELAAKNGGLIGAVTKLFQSAAPGDLPVLAEEVKPLLVQRKIPGDFVDKLVAQRVPAISTAQNESTIAVKAAQVMKANRDAVRKSIANTASPEAFRRPQFIPRTAVR